MEEENEIEICGFSYSRRREGFPELIAPSKEGGLEADLYICGSASFYETVSRALLKLSSQHNNETTTLLDKAFSQGRVMLDIFSPSRPVPLDPPPPGVVRSYLLRIWSAIQVNAYGSPVHGNVYDVTDFLPIHPGGSLIVSTSAGQDCSTFFDRVGHSSDGEVMSLLSNYLIGSFGSQS